jgi:RsiW-degrading membrane proteinase PrsW (M82 family)
VSGGMSTMVCEACETEVPDAPFCGRCGAAREGRRGWLRLRAYAAAPHEHTLLPSIASSLFPQLPRRSRTPFRIGLILLFVALTAFSVLRWQAPLITVGALGLPILFLMYLRESEIDDDQPRSTLVVTALMGIALGIAWAFVTDMLVVDAYAYALSLSEDADDTQTLADVLFVLAFPLTFAVLMLIPTVVIRLVRPGIRESLDGFVIGALAAISFTAAATLTQLAPQFQTGVTAADWSMDTFLIEAGIQVIAVPLTSAALGGLVGVTLWFRRRIAMATSVLVTLGFYAIMGALDLYGFPLLLQLAVYLSITALSLVALRIGIQAALMSEELDLEDPSERLECPYCDTVVAEMAFCPNCGVAARAASRSSRAERRISPDDTAHFRRTPYSRLLLVLSVGAVVTAAGGVVAAVVATPDIPAYQCPPDCGRPPIAEPLESYPRYVSKDGAFSVQYPGPGTAYEATLNPDGVSLKFTGGDTGTMEFFGAPADGKTPKQIVEYLISQKFPDATTDYEIPNAMVGYEPGYGVVVDVYPNDARSSFARLRLLVMASVKYDYALIAAALGPYHEFTREFGPGHPSGANLQLAMDMGKYVNSFRWRDPDS